MGLTVLAFGIAQDLIGQKKVVLELNQKSIELGKLKELLVKLYPKLVQLDSFLIAVNNEYVKDSNRLIQLTDEVALIPPTSGG